MPTLPSLPAGTRADITGRETGHETRRRIRILVVDDSVVMRRLVSRVFEQDVSIEVVGFAANGTLALAQEALLKPDVITLDIEMPEMDGLATLRALRARGSKAVIIMCSTLTTRGATSTIDALMRGANEYVTKPAGADAPEAALEQLRHELIPKIKQFFVRHEPPVVPERAHAPARAASIPPPQRRAAQLAASPEILAIGVSTGGPTALLDLLPRLPASFPLPIVIVQHMPPVFTRQLAERLSAESGIEVLEATAGMPLRPGRAVLAPGDYHLRLKRDAQGVSAVLDQGERENSCRPAVDVLFRSVGQIFGGRAIGLILTGMGQDGLIGAQLLRQQGAYIIAQDRESSVVWGMPGAVVDAGCADAVVSLSEVAPTILRQVATL